MSCLNDYQSVAPASVMMKVFERLLCKHLSSITLDPHQFAHRANRSVDDAVSLCLHSVLQHLECSLTYARVLFVEFSSAFNIIVPVKLINYKNLVSMLVCVSGSTTFYVTENKLSELVKISHRLSSRTSAPPPSSVSYQLYCTLYTRTSVDPILSQHCCISLLMTPWWSVLFQTMMNLDTAGKKWSW